MLSLTSYLMAKPQPGHLMSPLVNRTLVESDIGSPVSVRVEADVPRRIAVCAAIRKTSRTTNTMSKKTRERIYLDSFLKAVGWSCAPSDVAEGESPDFVVTLRRRTVGVEIVQVFADQTPKKSKMREGESIRLRWLAELARDYYDSGGPAARVQVQFQPSYFERIRGEIPPELRAKIIERLVARVRRMKPGDHLTSRIRGKHQSLLVTLWIWALPRSLGRYSRWRLGNDAVGWARTLLPGHVEDLIAKKAALLPEYRRRASEVVLVIVADKFLVSGMIIWEGVRLSPQGFEAVYLLHFPESEVDRIS